MLTAAFIFVLSFAALIQFAVLQWRASLVRIASTLQAEDDPNLLKVQDFKDVAAYRKLCPDLGGANSAPPKLRLVRLYHCLLQGMNRLTSARWTTEEMELCSRYALAVIMQQVERTHAVATEVNSF